MNWQIRATNRLAFGMMSAAWLGASALADTVYVNGTCGDDGWTGASEVCAAPDGPKRTIQAGIGAAPSGSEVVIGPGVYSGPGNTSIDLMQKSLTISGSDGDDLTVIDGDYAARAIELVNQGAVPQLIRNLTIRRCAPPSALNSIAGGVLVWSSTPTFQNCVFEFNHADVGAAGQVRAGGSTRFVECRFFQNLNTGGGGAGAVLTGGTQDGYSDLPAPILGHGHPSVTWINCDFSENGGGTAGGAVMALANAHLLSSQFSGNSTSFVSGALHLNTDSEVANCVFSHNSSAEDGVMFVGDNIAVSNCSSGANIGFGIGVAGEGNSITNCAMWNDSPASIVLLPGYSKTGEAEVTFCDVQDGWPGEGNIDADPLFAQPGSDDLRLSSGSPCIDVGQSSALPADEFDLDGDGDFAEPIPYDAAGNPRVQGAAVDMGAYEGGYKPLPPQDSALDLRPGEITFLIPEGGALNPVESPAAVVTNMSASAVDVMVTQYAGPVHPVAGGYSELGATMALETTLAPGFMFNKMFISFTAAELRGRDPLSLDLTSFNPATGNWRLAVEGNSAPSPGHAGPVGDRIAVEGTGSAWGVTTDLGDYGVFWDASLQKGFVWANLDYASDFAFGTILCYADCAPPNGDGLVDGTDVQGLLAAWSTTGGGIFDINLDGHVSGFDLALLLGAWGACEDGVAPITAPQKMIAPNWGRAVTATQREVDLDGNGVIDGRDLALILAAWSGDQLAPAESNAHDLNADGRVNRADMDVLMGR